MRPRDESDNGDESENRVTAENLNDVSRRDIHHVAFDVPDVGEAIRFFGAAFGVGPFYRLLNPLGDDPKRVGAGFGSWGGIYVELLARTGAGAGAGAPRLNHVAYLSAEPEQESARLSGLGLARSWEIRVGDVWAQFHDASHQIGCAIEIHRACPDLDAFFKLVAESSIGWDGSDPERVTPAPGTR
jgi:catechol 2,3-dioxygenase-like lactoylglutathione lyase family enzyme